MKILTVLSLLVMLVSVCGYGDVCAKNITLRNLKCEYKTNPLGIDALQPRLSWQIVSDTRASAQTAYQIRAAGSASDVSKSKSLLWDTGKVTSDQSIHIPYAGSGLESGERVYWQVRIWDQDNSATPWSDTAFWEMGLLKAGEWQADWIRQGGSALAKPTHYGVTDGRF